MIDDETVSRARAEELWVRAAEIQEERRREVGEIMRRPTADDVRLGEHEDALPYSAVREAAVEAGIDGSAVDAAALRVEAESFLDGTVSVRHAKTLRLDEYTVTESARLAAGPADVRNIIVDTLASPTFASAPVEIIDRADGGAILIYETAGADALSVGAASFASRVHDIADVTRFAVLLSPNAEGGSDVSVHCSLRSSARVHAVALRVVQGIGGAVGVGLAVAASTAVAAAAGFAGTPIAGAIVGVMAAAGGVAAGIGTGVGFRTLYRKARSGVRSAFRGLLTAVRARIGPG